MARDPGEASCREPVPRLDPSRTMEDGGPRARESLSAMTNAEKLGKVAGSDTTFHRRGSLWVGKCLICNGPVAFDAGTGEGATVEHIRARSRGGGEGLENLAIVHGRCNHEKGRRWDPKRRRPPEDYESLVARMLARRADRWREPAPTSRSGVDAIEARPRRR